MRNNNYLASELLKWYDKNARVLPWRTPPDKSKAGCRPDPYWVWLSEIMLQQTTVTVVKPYFKFFVIKWPTVMHLAAASDEEIMEAWAGLGYYRRARNLISCAKVVAAKYNGVFPDKEKLLLDLPGIGTYTSAAIKSIGFNKKATVVDGNVSRVICRLFAISTPISLSKKKIKCFAHSVLPGDRFGDYAQALMDLGSQICTPGNPNCKKCPIKEFCKSDNLGITQKIPKKIPKKILPSRYGYAFIALTTTNNIILERRPSNGLLGGTLCFPSSEWTESDNIIFNPPFDAEWDILNKAVTHTFSHFKLTLKIAHCITKYQPSQQVIVPMKGFNRTALPSLMRKVFDIWSNQSN